MRHTGWTILAAGYMLTVLASDGAAQLAGRDSVRSTRAGVFTTEQATRGRDVYEVVCRSCHTSATHTLAFTANWTGRRLSQLFDYVSQNMPQNSPGALSPEECALVLAYMLQMLGMPAGKTELPADAEALATIRFDTLSTTPGETKP